MAEPQANQAPADPPPAVASEPPPGNLGDFGYALLAVVWALVVIGAGMWLQSR